MDFASKLNQTAVYWAFSGRDGYGEKTYASGVEISVRWEDVSEEFIDKVGEKSISKSRVFTLTAVDTDGYLFLGELTDLSSSVSEDDPTQEELAYAIRGIESFPALDGTVSLRKAML